MESWEEEFGTLLGVVCNAAVAIRESGGGSGVIGAFDHREPMFSVVM